MKISVLGSGSTGNAVLLVANGTRVLVDAGMSAREIVRRMAILGEDANSLDGILVTHEHGDHCGGLRVLTRDLDCPVFISARTRDAYVCESRRVGIANDEPRKRADGQAQHLVLAHLSQRANNPYLAKITAETALRERAPLFPASTEVMLSFPKEPTAWIEV